MSDSDRVLRQRHYREWAIRRCLRHYSIVAPIVENAREHSVSVCVVTSIALFEMGARSALEQWVEHIVYRAGIVLARLRLLPGVPDISVGPFQMRPSTAFGWERRRALFGCVAIPQGVSNAEGLDRAADLCDPVTAMPLLIKLLTKMSEETVACSALSSIYSRYRGRTLTPSETDHYVLVGIHNALHRPATNRSYRRERQAGQSHSR